MSQTRMLRDWKNRDSGINHTENTEAQWTKDLF